MVARRTKVDREEVKIAGVPNPAAAMAAIGAYIGKWGITKAIAKYGERAAMAAGKNRNIVTKAEKTAGRGGSVPTRKPKVPGTKTQSGTEMPPTSIDKTAAQAARRAANKAAQVKRGKGRITKGVGTAVGAETVYEVGKAGKEAYDKTKATNRANQQIDAFARKSGERQAKVKAKADTNAKLNAALRTRTDADAVMTPLSSKVVTKPKGPKTNPTGARTIAASRKAKGTTFTGRDEKQKANVTREELAASGMSLRDYLNKQQGKTRRTEMKKGGAVKKTTKAKKTNKVRGSGIAVRGVRPAKMR
jgi:hypothetical protein